CTQPHSLLVALPISDAWRGRGFAALVDRIDRCGFGPSSTPRTRGSRPAPRPEAMPPKPWPIPQGSRLPREPSEGPRSFRRTATSLYPRVRGDDGRLLQDVSEDEEPGAHPHRRMHLPPAPRAPLQHPVGEEPEAQPVPAGMG